MSGPVLARTRAELDAALAVTRTHGRPVALVPTMGALHTGHAALLARAKALLPDDGAVVASIFVNPLQFGVGEDLHRYPRALEADLAVCADQDVGVVFAPAVGEVYPHGQPLVRVVPGPLGGILEGAVRPMHFAGVLTVVAKLFGLVRPDHAVFGEKDYQQLALIRQMSEELCLGIEVVGAPTVREEDGLALSSRNRFLSPVERSRALTLSAALRAGREAGSAGPDAVRRAGAAVLAEAGIEPDYLALTAPDLGSEPDRGDARLLVAARIGATRLIDNVPVLLGDPPHRKVEP